MRAYSRDLREKVIEAVKNGTGVIEVARLFGLSRSTVWNYTKRQREKGEVYYKQQGGYRKSKLEGHKKRVIGWINEKPGITLHQILEKLGEECQVKIGVGTLHYHLIKMGYSFKKNVSGERAWTFRHTCQTEAVEVETT